MSQQSNPYEEAAQALLRESGCTVRTYRTSNTGSAYTHADDWGINVPRARGPVSFGVFAHEIGHQMLHRHNGSKPRWLEEIEAWEYALEQFDRFGLKGIERSRKDAATHLAFKAHKLYLHKGVKTETVLAMLRRYPSWVWLEDGQLPILHPEMSRERKALDA